VARSEEKFMQIEKMGIDFHLGGKSRFRIKDIVNGNTVIGMQLCRAIQKKLNVDL
jgi:hypothetical protein